MANIYGNMQLVIKASAVRDMSNIFELITGTEL